MKSNDVLGAALQDALDNNKDFQISILGEERVRAILKTGPASVLNDVFQYESKDREIYIPLSAISRLIVNKS